MIHPIRVINGMNWLTGKISHMGLHHEIDHGMIPWDCIHENTYIYIYISVYIHHLMGLYNGINGIIMGCGSNEI